MIGCLAALGCPRNQRRQTDRTVENKGKKSVSPFCQLSCSVQSFPYIILANETDFLLPALLCTICNLHIPSAVVVACTFCSSCVQSHAFHVVGSLRIHVQHRFTSRFCFRLPPLIVTALEMSYIITACSKCNYYTQNKSLSMKTRTLPQSWLSLMWQCSAVQCIPQTWHFIPP